MQVLLAWPEIGRFACANFCQYVHPCGYDELGSDEAVYEQSDDEHKADLVTTVVCHGNEKGVDGTSLRSSVSETNNGKKETIMIRPAAEMTPPVVLRANATDLWILSCSGM